MNFKELKLSGGYVLEIEPNEDERGFFSRLFCVREFEGRGLETKWVQVNDSLTKEKGTLRGLHFQLKPYEETKVVRCTKGSIWDVIVDLRINSSTFSQWFGTELNETNRTMMYVPKGFAHGFVSLEDNSEIIYLVSQYYKREAENTLVWNDEDVKIEWPIDITSVSEKDRNGKTVQQLKELISNNLHS